MTPSWLQPYVVIYEVGFIGQTSALGLENVIMTVPLLKEIASTINGVSPHMSSGHRSIIIIKVFLIVL